MAFDMNAVGGYGSGRNGDVVYASGQINSYANVTAMFQNTLTIGTPSNGVYETFTAGTKILLHVSATNGTSQETTYLGGWQVLSITKVNGSVLTVSPAITCITEADFAKYYVQVVTVAEFASLTLNSGKDITPPAYSLTAKYGGIVVLKCNGSLTLAGGNINLASKGIPRDSANFKYRPLTPQEQDAENDQEYHAGWENTNVYYRAKMNVGDGMAFLFLASLKCGSNSVVGTPGNTGRQYNRGWCGKDNARYSTAGGGVSVGGSTILLVAKLINSFSPSMIAKYSSVEDKKSSQRGLSACFIASNTPLVNDEGLYAYSCVSDKAGLTQKLHVNSFGKGTLGDATNPTGPLNNYASVISMSSDGKTIGYANKTTNGLAPIGTGALVMVHFSKQRDDSRMSSVGHFKLARVLADDGKDLTLDCSLVDLGNLGDYVCQVISIPEFGNLTISTNYTATPAWDNSKGIGGILAIACSEMLDISNGELNVEKKGGGAWTFSSTTGNYQDADCLPLPDGHGAVFLLTKQLNMNAASRIGATYDGSVTRSRGGGGAGYGGAAVPNGSDIYAAYGIYKGGGGSASDFVRETMWGKTHGGSYHAETGACCMIIVDEMQSFYLNAISTGGASGRYNANKDWLHTGGGAAGWAFIYCNSVDNMHEEGVKYL